MFVYWSKSIFKFQIVDYKLISGSELLDSNPERYASGIRTRVSMKNRPPYFNIGIKTKMIFSTVAVSVANARSLRH